MGRAGLTVGCDVDGQYYVRFTTDSSKDAHVWIERSSRNTIDHVVPVDIGDDVAAYDVQVDGVADERLKVSASEDERTENWDILATTDGGCRVNVTQPAVIDAPPRDDPDDGGIIFD